MVDVLGVPAKHIWDKPRQIAESVAEHQLTAVPAGHSVSKALAIDTPILTPGGFVPISELRTGDTVYGECGQRVRVTGRSPVSRRQTYRVIFDDGATIVACDEHLWSAHDYVTRKRLRRHGVYYADAWCQCQTVPTEHIASSLLYNGQGNWSVPVAAAISGRGHLPDAYTIGLWLGDGTRGTGGITIGHRDSDEILARVAKDGYQISRQPSQDQPGCALYTILGLTKRLRALGIIWDKHIRPDWLRLQIGDRWDLLRGYLDADGYRLTNGHSAALGTTDKRLYDSVVPLIASLGVKVFCGTESIVYKGNPKLVYKLNFSPGTQPFGLCRKKIKVSSNNRNRHNARMIRACTPTGEQEVCCIATDNPTGLYLAGEHLIPTHNTWLAGRLVCWFKSCFRPSTVITTAPSDNQVRNQLWREIASAYRAANIPLGGNMTSLQWDMKLRDADLAGLDPMDREMFSKDFAIGFSTSADSATEHATKMQGWHNKHVLVILDEACGILRQIWRTVLEGLVVNDRCKVLAIGNPTDPESDFADAVRLGGRLDHLEHSSESYMSDHGWHVVPVSVRDTPNYREDREVIPGVAGRSFERRILTRHRHGSDGYLIRVEGAFPRTKEGTYYGAELARARADHRIGDYPYDPSFPVYRFADFGDVWTAAIDVQVIRGRIRIINDYWDNAGDAYSHGGEIPVDARGALGCIKSMQAMPYVWGDTHYAGPDLEGSNRQSFTASGTTTRDVLLGLGRSFLAVKKVSFQEGIEATRFLWPQLDVDEKGAATFLKAAAGYCKLKNERLSTDDQPAYYNQPAQTWHRHMMDALRHLAIQYRFGAVGGESFSYSPSASWPSVHRGSPIVMAPMGL